MTAPIPDAPGAQGTPAPAEPAAPAGPPQLSDDHAEVLLADAVAAAEAAGDTNPWADPEKARSEIERLRRENGAARTNAKAQAAEEARQQLAQEIGKALGLVPDAADPAKLTEQLTTQTAAAKQAQLELAVYQAASAAGVNASVLLDSRSFMDKVSQTAPGDHLAVAAAIGDAVTANPNLTGAQGGPRLPAPNPAQGAAAPAPAGKAQITTREQLQTMTPEQINAARLDGRLDQLLGIQK